MRYRITFENFIGVTLILCIGGSEILMQIPVYFPQSRAMAIFENLKKNLFLHSVCVSVCVSVHV